MVYYTNASMTFGIPRTKWVALNYFNDMTLELDMHQMNWASRGRIILLLFTNTFIYPNFSHCSLSPSIPLKKARKSSQNLQTPTIIIKNIFNFFSSSITKMVYHTDASMTLGEICTKKLSELQQAHECTFNSFLFWFSTVVECLYFSSG